MKILEKVETQTWYVYIARANTGRYYVGISSSPENRIKDHNSKRGSRFAKQQGPFKLIYISSTFPSKADARKREIQIKSWSKNKKSKLISGEWK